MEYTKFEQLILNMQKAIDKDRSFYEIGIDFKEDVFDPYWHMINSLIAEIFTEAQVEIIDWVAFDTDFWQKEELKMTDRDGNHICKDIKGLYDVIYNKEIK